MIGIDLFSGAGGMSLGARWAGIDVRVAVEADRHAAATFAQNHVGVTVINKPIQEVPSIEVPRRRGPVILFGGPPCQGFSTSNQRTRSSKNPLNWLFRDYVRIVRVVMPDWILFENVPGMAHTEGGRFLRAVLSEFARLRYRTCHFVLNAATFGLPQNRSRLFIVANLHGIDVSAPIPLNTVVTVRDAIADLPVLRNGASVDELPHRCASISPYASALRGHLRKCRNHLVSLNAPAIVDRYKYVPQGGNWIDIPARCMGNYADRNRCHTGIYRRLTYDEPSIVIGNFRKNMLIHPTQNRGLSVREAARLQSFPDDFVFTGSIGFQQQQVGNAVPPLLALRVFESILSLTRERIKCGRNNH
jgi:DNA (cytosine-5)-methyltransferase 1